MMIKKKWIFPAAVLAVLALGAATVLYSKPNPHFVINDGAAAFEYAFQNKDAIQPSGKMVEISLRNKGEKLQNYSPANIEQFCTIKPYIELDSALLDVLDQELLAQGIIKPKGDANIASKMPAIKFYSLLSAGPQETSLTEVENNGSAYIKVHCPSNQNVKISNRGAGRVEILTGYLENAIVENLGVGDVVMPNIKKLVKIDSRGTGSVAVGEAAKADVTLYGVGTVSFKNEPEMTSTIRGIGVIKTKAPHPYQ
ncbi:DUF2807 domain-containing protein [Chitinibacter sp. FCG-7]|uniref:DUF2807 domain-containing protein n=1 Tax=Chitinibacter mangrovi TaxID=3153927 RepID=A0AAU7F618_9NEIS